MNRGLFISKGTGRDRDVLNGLNLINVLMFKGEIKQNVSFLILLKSKSSRLMYELVFFYHKKTTKQLKTKLGKPNIVVKVLI